jgi:transketolase C-terminal domain/subunit
MSFIAINDIYAKSGKAEELLKRHQLTAADIESAARSLLTKKRS